MCSKGLILADVWQKTTKFCKAFILHLKLNKLKFFKLIYFWLFNSVQSLNCVWLLATVSHEPQHTRPPCPSPTPGVHPNPCPLSRWCHPTISSSVVPFSSCAQSFPTSGSFPMSQFFASGGQSIEVSASTSVLPMNTQDWSPLGWTGWISLKSKGLSRVFSNTTVQKHFRLYRVFIAASGLSLVVTSRHSCLVACVACAFRWHLLLQLKGTRACGLR